MKDEYRKLSVELFGICDTVKNAKSKRLNLNQNQNIDWDEVKYRSDVASESESFTAEKTSRVSLEDMKNGLLKMTQLNTKDLNFHMNSAYPKRENVVEHVHEVNNNPDLNIV